MNIVAGYIMPTRNDACNSIQTTFEISKVERYIRQKRAEGLESFGLTHVLLAAYVRCIAKYPGVNRFFSGQRVYQRDDDVQFTMTIKKDMRTDGEETTIKLHLKPTDTTKEVYEKLNDLIDEVKNTPLDSTFDHVAALLASMPRLLLKFVVWFLKTLDYFGMLPTFLTDLSPFHGTVIFTSMGSLGIPPIVHHLYNFGNLPVFVAFGRKYRKVELDPAGQARDAPLCRLRHEYGRAYRRRLLLRDRHEVLRKAPARAGAARSFARGSHPRYSLIPNIRSSCVCTACAGAFSVSVSRTAVCIRLK